MILGLSANAFAEENLLRYANTGYVYYCVGRGSDSDNDYIDTTKEAETVGNYISRWGYDSNLFENARQSDFNDGRLNSPILYFAGHGNATSVNTGGTSGISSMGTAGYKDIRNLDFSTNELVFLAACKTAYNGTPNLPIARAIANQGVSGQICTIGWTGKPRTTHMRKFSASFFEALDNGMSYEDAAYQAKEATKSVTGGGTNGADIYTYKLFGATTNTITNIGNNLKRSAKKSMVDMLIDDSLTQYIVDGDVNYYEFSKDYNEIEQCIKENLNANFDINDFEVTEDGAEGENAFNSLSFRFVVDGLVSDFGYNIVIENNKVLLVTQIGTDIINYVPVIDKENMLSDEELCKMALADDDDSVVAEQKVNKYVDSATGKIKYSVDTVYGTEEGGYSAVGFEYLQ